MEIQYNLYGDDSAYVGIARSGTIRDENGTSIGSNKITQPAVNFVQNMSFIDTLLANILLWMLLFRM